MRINNDDGYFSESASRNTSDAIRHDSRGRTSDAIECYERACHALAVLARMHSQDRRMVKVWTERRMAYQNRIKALKRKRTSRLQLAIGIVAAVACSAGSRADPVMGVP